MEYFEFLCERFACDYNGTRSQFTIRNIITDKIYKPVMTSKNKNYVKFCNASNKKIPFYFSANLVDSSYIGGSLRNIKFYDTEEFKIKYCEYLI